MKNIHGDFGPVIYFHVPKFEEGRLEEEIMLC